MRALDVDAEYKLTTRRPRNVCVEVVIIPPSSLKVPLDHVCRKRMHEHR